MNLSHVEFELAEALMHLQALVTAFREHRIQPDDTPELSANLNHILEHICYAWNSKSLSTEEILTLPQNEFNRLCDTVPNFYATKVMGETAG